MRKGLAQAATRMLHNVLCARAPGDSGTCCHGLAGRFRSDPRAQSLVHAKPRSSRTVTTRLVVASPGCRWSNARVSLGALSECSRFSRFVRRLGDNSVGWARGVTPTISRRALTFTAKAFMLRSGRVFGRKSAGRFRWLRRRTIEAALSCTLLPISSGAARTVWRWSGARRVLDRVDLVCSRAASCTRPAFGYAPGLSE